jgi:hypothetical protein
MELYDSHGVNTLRKELNTMLAKEEVVWRQRSRVNWLKDGDQNTRFFMSVLVNEKAPIPSRDFGIMKIFGRLICSEVEQIAIGLL